MPQNKRLTIAGIYAWWPVGLTCLGLWVLGGVLAVQLSTSSQEAERAIHRLRAVLQLETLMSRLQQEQQVAETLPWDKSQFDQTVNRSTVAWRQLQQTATPSEAGPDTGMDLSPLQIAWQRLQTYRQLREEEDAESVVHDVSAYQSLQRQMTTMGLQNSQVDGAGLIAVRLLYGELQHLQAGLKLQLTQADTSAEGYGALLEQAMRVDLLAEYSAPMMSEKQQRLFDEIFTVAWQPAYDHLKQIIQADDVAVMARHMPTLLKEMQATLDQLETLLADSRDTLSTQAEQTQTNQVQVWWIWAVCMLGAPALAVGLNALQQARQRERLSQLLAWVQVMACGNLTTPPDPILTGGDAFGQVTQHLDELRHAWRRVLLQIRAQCDRLTAAQAVVEDTQAAETVLSPSSEQLAALPVADFSPDLSHGVGDAPQYTLQQYALHSGDEWADDLRRHLSTLESAQTALNQLLTDVNDKQAVDTAQLLKATEPVNACLGQLTRLIDDVNGLSQWIDALQACATQSEHLVRQAQAQAKQLADLSQDETADTGPLQALQQETRRVQDQVQGLLSGLRPLLEAGKTPVTTRLPSRTVAPAPPPSSTVAEGLRDILNGFSF